MEQCHEKGHQTQQELDDSEAARVEVQEELVSVKLKYNQLAARINANKTILSLLGIARVEPIT